MQKLTEELVEALPVDGRDRIVFDGGGFGVRVTPAGRKIFIAQARVRGEVCRVSVGTFPEMKVRKARVDALAAVAAMRRGEDPRADRAARAKAIEAGGTTVAAFAERWLAEYVRPKLKPRTVADYERLIEQKIGPALGHLICQPRRQGGRAEASRRNAGDATPRQLHRGDVPRADDIRRGLRAAAADEQSGAARSRCTASGRASGFCRRMRSARRPRP